METDVKEQLTTKTPISYWGGKQQLAPRILKLIPTHKSYVEPFFGGGAVFFAKPESRIEVINDINDNMVNFYRVVKRTDTFEKLCEELDLTLHSEYQYGQAKAIWKAGRHDCRIMRAWAVFVLSHQSFRNSMGTWAYSLDRNMAAQFTNMKKMLDERYLKRLERTQIFCRDALRVIVNTDRVDTFLFVDPPYYNADMGPYEGYTLEDFQKLLEALGRVKGKFLLTTYPSEMLTRYAERNSWHTINNEMHLSASAKTGKKKTEVFTMNYKPGNHLLL